VPLDKAEAAIHGHEAETPRARLISTTHRQGVAMDYGMIGKIEKAKRYAEERERIHFEAFRATFDGENNPHTVEFSQGSWKCDCDFFLTRGVCSHTMALERILDRMLPQTVATG